MIRRVSCAVLVAALVAAPPAFAQTVADVDAYSAAVRAFATTGDAALAIRGIREWSPRQFGSAVEQYVTRGDAMLDRAAVLQLEIAVGLVAAAPALAENHLGLGEFLLQKQRQSPRHTLNISPDQLAAFAERWYVAAGSTFLWVNNPRVAESFLNAGLKLLPESAELRLIEGVRLEVEALDGTATAFSDAGLRAHTRAERLRFLLLAKNQYQKLLKEHPTLVRARVRLGRVFWVLDELLEAIVELSQARADPRDRKQQYLAAMFLGGLYDQQRNIAAAREAYEAALTFAPGSQAATVGLGYLELMAGRPDRAQELARRLLLAKRQDDEWWSYRNGGLDLDALRWLEAWVTR